MLSKKMNILLVTGIGAMVLVGSGLFLTMSSTKNQEPHDITPKVAEWTTFFWFCGDGNLADWNMMLCNIHYLEMVNSSEEVNLIGILDRQEHGDTKILKIEQGNSTQMPISLIDANWTDDELNLGDPEALEKFLIWGVDNYPAEHYNIHLVDHGGGWRGMCWDESSNDHLSLPEIRQVCETMKTHIGRNVDILSTEGCLVGMMEFGYELRNCVDFYVGGSTYGWGAEAEPENDIWDAGNWQYDSCWQELVDNPKMNSEEFTLVMIDTFEPYGPWTAAPFIPKETYSDVMAAYNLSVMENLAGAVESFVQELTDKVTGIGKTVHQTNLINNILGHPELPKERYTEYFSAQMDWIGAAVYTNYDLYDFAYMLSGNTAGALKNQYATDVMELVEECVLKCRKHHEKPGHPDAHGISIYIPYRSTEYNAEYEEIAFARDTGWDEFLRAVHWTN